MSESYHLYRSAWRADAQDGQHRHHLLLPRQTRRTPGPIVVKPSEPEKGSSAKKKDGTPKIRCPLCGWQPGTWDLWGCTCGCIWNTFDTRGLCPACGKQWTETQCLACHRLSKHEKWYARDDE